MTDAASSTTRSTIYWAPKNVSLTPVCHPTTKKPISKGKKRTYESISRNTDSSTTSAQGLTGTTKAFFPFWTDSSEEWSKRLPWRTVTDSAAFRSNYWSISFDSLARDSWFSATRQALAPPSQNQTPLNSQTTSSLLSPYLWQRIMATVPQKAENVNKAKPPKAKKRKKDGVEKVPAGKCKRIRVYPTEEQKTILLRWFGAARWTYNECLEHCRLGADRSKKALRALCINKEAIQEKNPWLMDTPYDIRDEAMADLLKAYKTCATLKTGFPNKFRARKDASQSIVIRAKYWGLSRGEYSHIFKSSVLCSSEKLPETVDYDIRVVRTRDGKYYLCIPQPLEIRSVREAPLSTNYLDGIVALDPGVRTLVAMLIASGAFVEWGRADMARIFRLCLAHDKLQSKWSGRDIKHRQRYRMKKAGARLRFRIRNLIDECHKKLTLWLVLNFRVILLPEFATSGMVTRGGRKINSKTARNMLSWSHYRFRQRLLAKARECPWCTVIIVNESYTSKTCGQCGSIHQKLGGSKHFRCPECKFSVDRDLNGARNILIKYLTEKL